MLKGKTLLGKKYILIDTIWLSLVFFYDFLSVYTLDYEMYRFDYDMYIMYMYQHMVFIYFIYSSKINILT